MLGKTLVRKRLWPGGSGGPLQFEMLQRNASLVVYGLDCVALRGLGN